MCALFGWLDYKGVFHIGNTRRICSSFFCRICQSLCQLFQQLI